MMIRATISSKIAISEALLISFLEAENLCIWYPNYAYLEEHMQFLLLVKLNMTPYHILIGNFDAGHGIICGRG